MDLIPLDFNSLRRIKSAPVVGDDFIKLLKNVKLLKPLVHELLNREAIIIESSEFELGSLLSQLKDLVLPAVSITAITTDEKVIKILCIYITESKFDLRDIIWSYVSSIIAAYKITGELNQYTGGIKFYIFCGFDWNPDAQTIESLTLANKSHKIILKDILELVFIKYLEYSLLREGALSDFCSVLAGKDNSSQYCRDIRKFL